MPSIYLSPSTQEGNTGAGEYINEEVIMNKIADVVQPILIRHSTVVYRNNPKMDLYQVVADSNAKKPDIHLALHSNGSRDRTARGCMVFCHRFGGNGHRLAIIIFNRIAAITPISDFQVYEGANYYGEGKHMYELAYTDAPAALVEIDFHDNPESAAWILANIKLIGEELAKGILEYFGIAFIPEKTDVLGRGSLGVKVKELQEKLNLLGYALVLDGDFGPATEAAVRSFQSSYDLTITGKADDKTLALLNEEIEKWRAIRVLEASNIIPKNTHHPDDTVKWYELAEYMCKVFNIKI